MKKLNIWSDEGSVSRSVIENFAQELDVIFPESYISLISKHDYLYLEDNIFDFIDNYGNQDERDIIFLGYKVEITDNSDIYTYSQVNNEYAYGNKIIAFGSSANGDYICFDYRNNSNEPSIALMHHDDFIENDLGVRMQVSHIANNFDEFMLKLHS